MRKGQKGSSMIHVRLDEFLRVPGNLEWLIVDLWALWVTTDPLKPTVYPWESLKHELNWLITVENDSNLWNTPSALRRVFWQFKLFSLTLDCYLALCDNSQPLAITISRVFLIFSRFSVRFHGFGISDYTVEIFSAIFVTRLNTNILRCFRQCECFNVECFNKISFAM